jgi:hypothetical protein
VAANTPNAGGETFGPGGGRVGAILLSPFIRPGSVLQKSFNHYSLLRSTEDLLGLGHIGYADTPNPGAFGDDVFNGPRCIDHPLPEGAETPLPRGTAIASARIKHKRKGSKGKDKLLLSMERSADLSIKTKVGKKNRRVGPRTATACESYTVTLPRRHKAVYVVATVGDAQELRKFKR